MGIAELKEEDMPMVQLEQPLFLDLNEEEQIKATESYGAFVYKCVLTYLRGLEISELKEEDMPMVCLGIN